MRPYKTSSITVPLDARTARVLDKFAERNGERRVPAARRILETVLADPDLIARVEAADDWLA